MSTRFTVGKPEAFIQVKFTRTQAAFNPNYLPWRDKLEEIIITPLMCVHHEKVYGDWDDPEKEQPKHDGFIFEDQVTSKIYHNQYPRASYGQLDDSNNWIARCPHDFFVRLTHLESHVDNILRGLRQFKKDGHVNEHDLLKAHLEEIEKKALEMNIKLSYEPHVIHYLEETGKPPEVIPDWLDCKVEFI